MEKKSFILNTIHWHEIADKLNVLPIEQALNEHIDLSNYGTGVRRIYFTYIAVRPTNTIHENEARYLAKSKTLDLSLQLSYEHVLTAEPARVLHMMAALFLVSIDLYERFRIKEFDEENFRQDVRNLFEQRGWIAGQLEIQPVQS